MHPAASVIVFTTLSGAGYGALAVLAGFALAGQAMPGIWPVVTALGAALIFVTVGLLSSMLHLGRPERAWRALTQVGSSWLSREGLLALLVYPAVLLFGYGLLATEFQGAWSFTALAVLLLAAATVAATGMIYASLKPIPAWRHGLVVPGYLLFAAASGAAWLLPLDLAAGRNLQPVLGPAVPLLCVLGAALKLAYWRALKRQNPFGLAASGEARSRQAPSRGAALGLPEMEQVDPLDPPSTDSTYLQREMGFRIARKHARKLRMIAVLGGFILPALLAGLALVPSHPVPAVLLALSAAILVQAGLLVERWLFFAEARHLVTLYFR